MHRKLLVAGIAATAILLAGCSSTSSSSSSSAAPDTAAPAASDSALASASDAAPAVTTDDSNCGDPASYCVGLVTDTGKVDDKSFNQSAWEGAQAAATELGAYSKYVESTDPKDFPSNIQQFVDKKYDVIVTVGFLMGEAATTAAKANPTIRELLDAAAEGLAQQIAAVQQQPLLVVLGLRRRRRRRNNRRTIIKETKIGSRGICPRGCSSGILQE
jgi:basic membrane lipoprotein Med (substrate-binding protein (PBP1-ABC) superfamily)